MKKIELIFKKLLLLLLGSVLKRKDCAPDYFHNRRIDSILFIRPEKIGDIFIAFPIFDVLRKNYPDIKISIIGSPDCLPILKNDPRFANIYLYKKKLFSDIQMLSSARKNKYDAVVDLVGRDSAITLLLTALSAPNKPRLALGKNKLAGYYNFNYNLRRNNSGHMITNSLALLEAFALAYEKDDCYAPPYLNDNDKAIADSFIKSLRLEDNTNLLGYNLSAGGADRKLSEQTSLDLMNMLLRDNNRNRIILFALGEDRKTGERLIEKIPHRVDLIRDGLSLTEASAVISYLDCFITPDTSLVHIARSFKVPVVAIYKNYLENYKIWYPFGQTDGIILSDSADNIDNISAGHIFDEYKKLIASGVEKQCQNSRS